MHTVILVVVVTLVAGALGYLYGAKVQAAAQAKLSSVEASVKAKL